MQTNFSQDNAIFLPLVIISKIIWFLGLKLCFDLHASLIFSVLDGTNKMLRVTYYLIINSNVSQSFDQCGGKSISFQLYDQ